MRLARLETECSWSRESLPTLSRTLISFSTRNTSKDLQTAVNKLLSKGAIEPVFRPETKGFFSRLFLVPKKGRGFTSCHRSLPLERPSGYSAVQDGDPGFSPGFHQRERMDCVHRHTGRISSRSRGKVCTEYLRFMVNGRVYQFTCLPFGLATSPRELPSCCDQWSSFCGSKVSSSMYIWTTGSSEHRPPYRPELMPI